MLPPAEYVRVVVRFIASFFKRRWAIHDYPLRITHHQIDPLTVKHKPLPWTVAVINWWQMRGDGETLPEAQQQLQKAFDEHQAKGEGLPRPGTGLPVNVTFGSTQQIEQFNDIAVHFMPRVIGFDRYDCFISDDSSLDDFPEPNEEYLRKIGVIYGIHPDELTDFKLSTIFRRIAQGRGA